MATACNQYKVEDYYLSSSLLKYTRISSIKTITNRSKNGLNTRFIKSIKAAGVLVNPKDITKNFIMVISRPKCSLRYISTSDSQLMISRSQINLRKTSSSLKLDQTNHQSMGEDTYPSQKPYFYTQ